MQRIGLLLALLAFIGCNGLSNLAKQDRVRLERIAEQVEKGDTASAITELEDYLTVYPQDDLAWTILGRVYVDVDRLDEALNAYESAIAINPRQFQAITGSGIVHRKRGDNDAAMEAYKKAVQIDPNYGHAYSSMAIIALKRNEDKKALRYARRGYDLDKSDPVIAANLAVAYHYNDDSENRDKFTGIAEQLGYANVDVLQQIYSGEMSVRD